MTLRPVNAPAEQGRLVASDETERVPLQTYPPI